MTTYQPCIKPSNSINIIYVFKKFTNFVVYNKLKIKNIYLNKEYNRLENNNNIFYFLFKFGGYIFIKNNISKFVNKINYN